ncbi:MAG: hypothetical protein NTZ59_03965 [Bacteroidetes bacterium]|jgi:hypothetical protein|nr:hypothetical protein [Bacteroidota bacterium]
MKRHRYISIIAILFIVLSCKSKKNIPDVSHIKIDLQVQRFDKDFFNADTNNLSKAFDSLNLKYGSFFADYLFQILRLNTTPEATLNEAKLFITDSIYHQIFIDAIAKFKSFDKIENEIKLGLQLTKYYFPTYQIPTKIITFVGPVDGVGVALTSNNALAVGLQGFMGKDYFAYQNGYIVQTYPAYKTKRFEPEYIATNCIKNIINEMYIDESKGRPLVERMIEEGRRLYVLDALLPNTEDSIKTGYSSVQLKDCYKNENVIWSFFVQGNLLFEREPSLVSPYVTDGPKTQELNEFAPGNIGQFTGWQIVKKWMNKNDKKTLQELMKTPAMTIFNEANYAP